MTHFQRRKPQPLSELRSPRPLLRRAGLAQLTQLETPRAELPPIFTGGVPGPQLARGTCSKDRLVARRLGELVPEPGGPAPCTSRSAKRMYPDAPGTQSIVDQVVFGRDMDFSGEEQFDESFMQMYSGGAGVRSGQLEERARGYRRYPSAPNMQSIVDQIVFGRDMDFSGDDQYDEEFLEMFVGSAGRLTTDPKLAVGENSMGPRRSDVAAVK